jgi:NADPH:quinone reductase-like Zn-dependent oxidoreductase
MRAITLESFDSDAALQEIPTPQIAPNEVLVRVRASSVNPIDNAIASGMLEDMVEHEFPIVLGRDFAGVVEQAGSDVRSLSVGDEVFGFVPGMGPTVHNGSWAEADRRPRVRRYPQARRHRRRQRRRRPDGRDHRPECP